MNNTGLCSVTFRNKRAFEIIRLAAENGLSCIEWGADIHVPPGDEKLARQIGEQTRDAGLECPSYGSYFRADCIEKFKPVLDSAAALGAKTVRIWAGEKDGENFSEREFEKLVRIVSDCADSAKKAKIKIAFEYHYGTYCNAARFVLKLLEAVAKENVGTYWQPAYWLKTASDEERIAANLNALSLLENDIINIHAYHWNGGARFALGDGFAEWKKYLRLIPSDCRLYIEFVREDSENNFRADAKTLRDLAEEVLEI